MPLRVVTIYFSLRSKDFRLTGIPRKSVRERNGPDLVCNTASFGRSVGVLDTFQRYCISAI